MSDLELSSSPKKVDPERWYATTITRVTLGFSEILDVFVWLPEIIAGLVIAVSASWDAVSFRSSTFIAVSRVVVDGCGSVLV